jgi:hypothetical protein
MKILDGTGLGYSAKVDSDNRLYVNSVDSGKLLHNSKDGAQSFMATTDVLTVTSTAEHHVLYISNPTTENFFFSDFWLSYNGGSTTWNKTAAIRFKGGATAPSANSTLIGFGNLNTGSANQSGLTVYKWNGTGVGMTLTATTAGMVTISRDGKYFPFEGFILAPGQAIAMSFECEEIGKVGITVTGFFDQGAIS